MSINDRLKELSTVEGFLGAALVSADGTCLASCSTGEIDLEVIGTLASGLFQTAQKESASMAVGRAELIHIQAPAGHILACSSYISTNPPGPDESHASLVVALRRDGNLALAKMKASSLIQAIPARFNDPHQGSDGKK